MCGGVSGDGKEDGRGMWCVRGAEAEECGRWVLERDRDCTFEFSCGALLAGWLEAVAGRVGEGAGDSTAFNTVVGSMSTSLLCDDIYRLELELCAHA